jgi:hypothetical protein
LQKLSKGEDYEETLKNLSKFKDSFLKYKNWKKRFRKENKQNIEK